MEKDTFDIRQHARFLRSTGRAILATNVYNLETLRGVLEGACICKTPIILQMTRASLEYMGIKTAVAMCRAACDDFGVTCSLHLDHGDSVELAERCLDVGFDSIMIDSSEKDLKQNIKTTRRVVELAMPYGAAVEAELGYVAKLGQSSSRVALTEPKDAALFVNETGVDWLAVAVGNAHGFYNGTPRIDIGRIAEIAAATEAILVLHGSSGIPDDQLRASIAAGITKINLATEIKNCFIHALRMRLSTTEGIDLRELFPVAVKGVAQLVTAKITVLA